MQIETRTILKPADGVLVLSLTIHPRGSGNRAAVKRLAEAAKKSEIGPHIVRVICGSTRLTLHLKASISLMRAVNEISSRAASNRDVPGQLPLFA